ncbi:hypothetical protein [Rummeliibacillus sp. BSL5]
MGKKIGVMSKEETKHVKCNTCAKNRHVEEALFCTRCGSKLDLSKIESSKTGILQ